MQVGNITKIKTVALFLVGIVILPSFSKAQKIVKHGDTYVSCQYDTIPGSLWLGQNIGKLILSWSGKNNEKENYIRYKFTDTCGGIEFIYYWEGEKVLQGFYRGDCHLYCDTGLTVDPTTGEEDSVQRIYYKPVRYGKWKSYRELLD